MEKDTTYAFLLPDGGKVSVICYEVHKRTYVEQVAESRGARGTSSYVNRPWEAFQYEKALKSWAKSYSNDPNVQACLMSQIDAIGAEIDRESAAYLEQFKKRWEKVDPDLRERTARALEGHEVTSAAEAESILRTAEAFTAMKKIGA